MARSSRLLAGFAMLVASTGTAMASVVITAGTTHGISCNAGLCVATSKSAVLSARSVEAMLAAGNLTIETGSEPTDIIVKAKLTWSTSSVLQLSAAQGITVDFMIYVAGPGGLTLETGNGSSVAIGPNGQIFMPIAPATLTINGVGYTLVRSLPELIAAADANPTAAIGLGNSYDAKNDRVYAHSPITSEFSGIFNGLGHVISYLYIRDTSGDNGVGLFQYVYPNGVVENIGLDKATVITSSTTTNDTTNVGTLVGVLAGTVSASRASGSISAGNGVNTSPTAGGLVGMVGGNTTFTGTIINSSSSVDVSVSGGNGGVAGGLVGRNFGGLVTQSEASGIVTGSFETIAGGLVGINSTPTGPNSTQAVISESFANEGVTLGSPTSLSDGIIGGLVGSNGGAIENCYATGSVTGGIGVTAGGLVGATTSGYKIRYSYATDSVSGKSQVGYKALLGGIVGSNATGPHTLDAYWDTTTDPLKKGAGHGPQTGLTGLTSAALAASLPSGFDAKTWAQSASIMGGLPYLIANPPAR